MKNTFTLLYLLLLLSVPSFAQTKWKVDPQHSSLNFNISHSGISIVNGKFTDYTGNLTTSGEKLDNAAFDFTVEIKSINTNVDARDNHLKSGDFFDADKFPKMTFKSTEILATGKPNQYLLYGNLTIKNVTKEVIFDAYYGGNLKSKQGEKIGMKAETIINRFDYGIDYDPTAVGVGKEVTVIVHLQFAKQ